MDGGRSSTKKYCREGEKRKRGERRVGESIAESNERQDAWKEGLETELLAAKKNVYIKEWNLSSAINLLWNIDFCRKHGEYNFYMLAFHI